MTMIKDRYPANWDAIALPTSEILAFLRVQQAPADHN
jgi:hypothetical protein